MESDRLKLQIVRFAMLISIGLYFLVANMIPAHAHASPNPMIFRVITLFSFLSLGVVLLVRKLLVANPSEALRSNPEDSAAFAKWKSGQVATWALGEATALYGLVLHFTGFSAVETIPFFVAGALLIVIFPPSLPERTG